MTDMFAHPGEGRADTEKVDRDRYGRYRLPHPVSGVPRSWTRVTTFAKSISDTYTLSLWSQRMVAKGVAMNPDLIALAASTPLSDRDALNEIAEKAKDRAGAKSAASLGTAVHAFCEQTDRGERPAVPADWQPHVAAYRAALDAYGLTVLPEYIERQVCVLGIDTAGTFDRIVRMHRPCSSCGEQLAVADLKTGRTLEYGWNEIAIQLACYAAAEHVWDLAAKRWDVLPGVCRCTGVIIHVPVQAEAPQATVHDVDLHAGWQAVELCSRVRSWRAHKGLAVPRVKAEAAGAVPAVASPPSYADRIAAAQTRADLSAIWSEAQAAGAWSPVLAELGKARLAAILADVTGG